MKNFAVIFLIFGLLAGCGSKDGSGLIPPGDRVPAPEIQADFLNLPTPASAPVARDAKKKIKKKKLPPQPAPSLKLSDLKGKVVILDFWATWCGPCRMELPSLVKLRDQYGPRGLEVVGLSVEINDNQPRENFTRFLKSYNIAYPVGLASLQTLQNYGVNPIPATFFIDKNGKIALSFIGVHPEEQFVAAIEKLLAE